jgi:hypothetical protein
VSDDELRELERRARNGGPQDRERWLRARARARDVAPGWVSVQLSVEAFEPEQVRAAAQATLERLLPAMQLAEDVGYRSSFYTEFRQAVSEAAGIWFSGLSEEWDPAWCPCHWLPRQPERIARCVERAVEQVTSVHRYHQQLIALGDARPAPGAPAHEEDLTGLASRVIDLVIGATDCNDSWYLEVAGALCFVLEGRGVSLGEGAREDLEDLIRARFGSSAQPSPQAREAVAQEFAGLARGAG